MNARDFLRQYKTISIRIEAKKEQIKRLREMAEYVSPDSFSGVHGSGVRDKIGDVSARIVSLENEIKADMKVLMGKQSEIIHAINGIKDDKQRTVLELRYINRLAFSEIAKRMGYSVEAVYAFHRKGLKNITVNYSKITVNYSKNVL